MRGQPLFCRQFQQAELPPQVLHHSSPAGTVISRSNDVMRHAEARIKRVELETVLSMGCDIRVASAVLEIGDGWVMHDRIESERFDGPKKTPADIVIIAAGYHAVHLEPQTDIPVVRLAEMDSGNILESTYAGAVFGLTLGVPKERIPLESEIKRT